MPKSNRKNPERESLSTSFKCRITTRRKLESHCWQCDPEKRITKTLHHNGKVLDTNSHIEGGESCMEPEKYILLSSNTLITSENFMALLQKVEELEDKISKLEK